MFHQGDPGDALHVVLHGAFLVRLQDHGGASVVPRLVGPGEFFGELALLSGSGRRSATVTALTAAETRVIDSLSFDTVRRRNPALDRFLVGFLTRRLVVMNDLLVEAYFHAVDVRVHRRLLELDRYAEPDPAGSRWIHISQLDLAALAGTTRPTVNRVLRHGAERQWLELARGRIRVADLDALRAAAY